MVYRNKEGYADPTAGGSNPRSRTKSKEKGIQPGSDKPCKRIKTDDRYCRV